MHYNLSSWRSCRSVSLLRKLKFPSFTIFFCKCLQVSLILAWSPIVVVQSLSLVWLFANTWTAACQASMSLTISQNLLNFMSIELVMLSNHLILCHLLLLPSIFPASGSFPMSQLFASGCQSIEASASALDFPMTIQDWFPLGLTGLISLESIGLSRVFCSITVQKHQFFGT